MINFRYHVISVVAVVVAVVAGLALGAAALDGPVAAPEGAGADLIGDSNRDLQGQVDRLWERLSAGEHFAEELAPVILGGRLATRSVIVVATPAAASDVSGVEAMLRAAGATLTGRLELTDHFADPARRDDLLDLALASLPPGVTSGLPATTDGVLASAALLGAVLFRQATPLPDGDVRSVLAAYVSQGFLTGRSGISSPADAVVVLSGAAAGSAGTAPAGTGAATQAGTDGMAVAALATGLGGGAGTVVLAGTGAASETAVGRLRGDAQAAARISTVDNVGTPQGKLATAWALADQMAGRVGHYGDGPGATGPLPVTATPSPSAGP